MAMAEDMKAFGLPPLTVEMRLRTLVTVRWFAIAGQFITTLAVWLYLQFDFAVFICLLIIGGWAFINAVLTIRYPQSLRLPANASLGLLIMDVVQLSLLLYFSGGLQNPFAILLIVPVIISATALPTRYTMRMSSMVIVAATLLAIWHEPLPWPAGNVLVIPNIYVLGQWVAIVSTLSFTAFYAFRVANEASKLRTALAATELVLEREKNLTTLDGLAAAAAHELGSPLATITVVAKEMERQLEAGSELAEDIALLRSQAERCRSILNRLSSLSLQDSAMLPPRKLSELLEEICEPHREFGIHIDFEIEENADIPFPRTPILVYGIGNLIENAVDFARSRVIIRAEREENHIVLAISDDGEGYQPDLLKRLGEPFISSSTRRRQGAGMGLGIFIANTLLERTGALLTFKNGLRGLLPGAGVILRWPLSDLKTEEDGPVSFDLREK